LNSQFLLLKNAMNLSDEQWALIQPLLPPPPSAALRGRPPLDDRSILDGILWKFRTHSPWYDMPAAYPSYQTCYRRFRMWLRTGLLNRILGQLYLDLRRRGGLDLQHLVDSGDIHFFRSNGKLKIELPPGLQDTWQSSVALALIGLSLRQSRRLAP
jgi:hypothetical protein